MLDLWLAAARLQFKQGSKEPMDIEFDHDSKESAESAEHMESRPTGR